MSSHKWHDFETMKKTIREIAADNLRELMARTPALDSQPKVGSKSGVGARTVGRVLNQEVSVSIDNLAAIARAFRLSAHDLLDPHLIARLDGNPVEIRTIATATKNPDVEDLVDQLNENELTYWIGLGKQIIEQRPRATAPPKRKRAEGGREEKIKQQVKT